MSSDNTIVILKTFRSAKEGPRGTWTNRVPNYVYRVAHVQAFDNFDYYKNKQPQNFGAYLYENFCMSEVYTDYNTASQAADRLLKSIDYVEYGIVKIDLDSYIFYKDL